MCLEGSSFSQATIPCFNVYMGIPLWIKWLSFPNTLSAHSIVCVDKTHTMEWADSCHIVYYDEVLGTVGRKVGRYLIVVDEVERSSNLTLTWIPMFSHFPSFSTQAVPCMLLSTSLSLPCLASLKKYSAQVPFNITLDRRPYVELWGFATGPWIPGLIFEDKLVPTEGPIFFTWTFRLDAICSPMVNGNVAGNSIWIRAHFLH